MMGMMSITQFLFASKRKREFTGKDNVIYILSKKTLTDNLPPLNGKFQTYIHYGVGHTAIFLYEDA